MLFENVSVLKEVPLILRKIHQQYIENKENIVLLSLNKQIIFSKNTLFKFRTQSTHKRRSILNWIYKK